MTRARQTVDKEVQAARVAEAVPDIGHDCFSQLVRDSRGAGMAVGGAGRRDGRGRSEPHGAMRFRIRPIDGAPARR